MRGAQRLASKGGLYLANWGTRRLVLRLPRGAIALKEAHQYCVSDVASAEQSRDHLVLDFCVDTEGEDPWEESVPSLDALAGLREELLGGDRRLLTSPGFSLLKATMS